MRKYLFASDLQKGQALLLVVLVIVISLTVGLSAVTRSVTNSRTTTEDENSQRAFSAAEAGIQQTLTNGSSIVSLSFGNNSQVATTQTDVGGTTQLLVNNGEETVQADQGTDVWLVNHNADGTANYSVPWPGTSVTVYWGNTNLPCSNAAIEVILLSGSNAASAVSNHYVADLCGGRNGSSGNNFISNAANFSTIPPKTIIIGSQTQTFFYKLTIPVTNGLLMRVIPLYYNSYIGIESVGSTIPLQGSTITSTGSAGPGAATGTGTIQRKLQYFQGYASLPAELFQYIYFVNPN